MTLKNKEDIHIFKENDVRYFIVYDPKQREYYNAQTDIFLSDDDISYLQLRPYDKITTPLPEPLPVDYFTRWEADETQCL